MPNVQVIDQLIEHYKTAEVHGWSYNHCVAGTMERLGLAPSWSDQTVADKLELPLDVSNRIVYGGACYLHYSHEDSIEYNRNVVIRMLNHLKVTGEVDWRAFANQPPSGSGEGILA